MCIKINKKLLPKLFLIKKELQKSGAILKFVEPENLHLTLKFFGDICDSKINEIKKEMKKNIEKVKPFVIKIENIDFFSNRNFIKVIWVGVSDEKQRFFELQNEINKALISIGLEPEKNIPHLTICRIKRQDNKENLLKILNILKNENIGEMTVNEVYLCSSELSREGPVYSILDTFKLRNNL